MISKNPAISRLTLEDMAKRWLQIVRFNESGIVINFVGDHFYTIPQVLSNKDLLKTILGKNYSAYILSYVEINPTTTIDTFKEIILKTCRVKKIEIDANRNLDEIIDVLIEKGFEIAFFVTRIDKHIYKDDLLIKLETISRNHRVSFLYFSEQNLTNAKFVDEQRIYTAMFQNVLFESLYTEVDARHFVSYNERLWNISLPDNIKEQILLLCGGDLWFLRQCMRFYRNNPKASVSEILSHFELITKAVATWSQLLPDEQQTIKELIIEEKRVPTHRNAFDYLCRIGLLVKSIRGYSLSIPLLLKAIEQQHAMSELQIRENEIYKGQEKISHEFTDIEKKLITLFLLHKNDVLTRGEIAQTLWKDPTDYSDWALDQLMSRLRRKLQKILHIKNIIQTKKGAGYVFHA